jgi:hypothetical protein
MSLKSRFLQFASTCSSRTHGVPALCAPTRTLFPARVHGPGCKSYLSRAPSLPKLTTRAYFPNTRFRSPGVFDGHSPGTSFPEIWVAMDIRQQKPAEAVPGFGLVPRHPHSIAAISSCFRFLFPSRFGLALARAETLRPAPGAALLRATPARPPGFGSPANISNLSQNRLQEILPVPPKKHVPRFGSSSLSLSGCPSQTGKKGLTDACISIA